MIMTFHCLLETRTTLQINPFAIFALICEIRDSGEVVIVQVQNPVPYFSDHRVHLTIRRSINKRLLTSLLSYIRCSGL